MKTTTIIITSVTLTIALIVAALTINAMAQTAQNGTNNSTSNIGKNGVLIKIHTDNLTSWSASITSGPGGLMNESSTNISRVGDRNFLLACPYGRYDVEIGIDAAAESTPNLTISAVFGGHVINSQHVSLVGGMHQVPNGKIAIVGGKVVQLVNSTNVANVAGACP
jgi:hypothetical protein